MIHSFIIKSLPLFYLLDASDELRLKLQPLIQALWAVIAVAAPIAVILGIAFALMGKMVSSLETAQKINLYIKRVIIALVCLIALGLAGQAALNLFPNFLPKS